MALKYDPESGYAGPRYSVGTEVGAFDRWTSDELITTLAIKNGKTLFSKAGKHLAEIAKKRFDGLQEFATDYIKAAKRYAVFLDVGKALLDLNKASKTVMCEKEKRPFFWEGVSIAARVVAAVGKLRKFPQAIKLQKGSERLETMLDFSDLTCSSIRAWQAVAGIKSNWQHYHAFVPRGEDEDVAIYPQAVRDAQYTNGIYNVCCLLSNLSGWLMAGCNVYYRFNKVDRKPPTFLLVMFYTSALVGAIFKVFVENDKAALENAGFKLKTLANRTSSLASMRGSP